MTATVVRLRSSGRCRFGDGTPGSFGLGGGIESAVAENSPPLCVSSSHRPLSCSPHARRHARLRTMTARPRCAPGGSDSSAERWWLRSRRDTSRSLAGPARELAVCYQDRPLEPVTDSDRTRRVVASTRLERRGFDLTAIDCGRSGFRRLEPQGSRVVIGCPRFDTRRPNDGDVAWSGCDRPVRSRVSGVVESTRVLESTSEFAGRTLRIVDDGPSKSIAFSSTGSGIPTDSRISRRTRTLRGPVVLERRRQFRARWSGWSRCWKPRSPPIRQNKPNYAIQNSLFERSSHQGCRRG